LVFIAAVLEKEGVSLKLCNLSLITEKFKNKKGGFMGCVLHQVKYPICGEPLVMRNGYYFCRTCFKNFEKSTHLKASDLKKMAGQISVGPAIKPETAHCKGKEGEDQVPSVRLSLLPVYYRLHDSLCQGV
jgi:hypothetical protein